MSKALLARVKAGVNIDTFNPFWYVEARLNPKARWSLLTDGKKWLTHRTRTAATREAKELQTRLRAKLSEVRPNDSQSAMG